jgi:diguanylate cyclase (GGDEF)-like protein
MLMLDVNDQSDAAGSAARILKSVAEPCTIDGVTLTVSASIGVAMYPEDGRSAEGLMKHADVAMYAAKKQRTGVLLYSELEAFSAESPRSPLDVPSTDPAIREAFDPPGWRA